jgi:hypothetical protein
MPEVIITIGHNVKGVLSRRGSMGVGRGKGKDFEA